MKNFFNKNKTLFLVLWVSLLSASVAFASSIIASEVGYTPSDSTWSVTNVQQATDSLYLSITRKNPIGEIIAYMGTIVPEYFLACDGTVYNISEYPYLAEQIKTNFGSYNKFGGNGTTTFAVPDLRGEFLRGTGTNSHTNQGSGPSVGTHQDATGIRHGVDWGWAIYTTDVDTTFNNQTVNVQSSKSTTASSYYFTVRPTNTAVMYAIRYE